jgi:hypothetical protein
MNQCIHGLQMPAGLPFPSFKASNMFLLEQYLLTLSIYCTLPLFPKLCFCIMQMRIAQGQSGIVQGLS